MYQDLLDSVVSIDEMDWSKVAKVAATTAVIGTLPIATHHLSKHGKGSPKEPTPIVKKSYKDKHFKKGAAVRDEEAVVLRSGKDITDAVSSALQDIDPKIAARVFSNSPSDIDIITIADIESSNNPKAYNQRSGAVGLCQITKATLKDVNRYLGTNWSIDDLYDAGKNYIASYIYMNIIIPKYLQYYGIEDNYKTRLAAYNWGIGNLRRAYTDKGDWESKLPAETKNYIAKYSRLMKEQFDPASHDVLLKHFWLDPDGQLVKADPDHIHSAERELQNLLSKEDLEEVEAPVYEYMYLTGRIKVSMYRDYYHSLYAIDLVRATRAQLKRIKAFESQSGEDINWVVFLDGGEDERYGEGYKRLVDLLRKENLIESVLVNESIIDYPRPGLCSQIWTHEDDEYVLRPEVVEIISDIINSYNSDLEKDIQNIHITGSIGTNQYQDDTDIDVHLILRKGSKFATPEEQKKLFKWVKEVRDEKGYKIGDHPFEVYIQLNPAQEYLSDAVYSVTDRRWIKGPKEVPLTFDPYEEYADIIDQVREVAKEADLDIGELKRDVIDYETIRKAIEGLPVEAQKKLLKRLADKLREIEKDIEELKDIKAKISKARKVASEPKTIDQALKDAELAAEWEEKNAMFKFLDRYDYLRIISRLEKLLADNELTDDEVETIRGILGEV